MSTNPIDLALSAADNAGPMVPRPYRVERVRKETSDTFTVELQPSAPGPAMAFAPGQFNMLYAFGVGESAVSISGDPAQPGTLVHTIREVGVVTRALHRLKPKQMLGVRGPFGTAWPVAEAKGADVVIVAGGIGLAPLRPALYQLLTSRGHYGRLALLYGTRTPSDILYFAELQQWHSRFDLDVQVTVDRAMGGWKGNVGTVTTLIPRSAFDPQSTVAMVCGPEIMMRFTVQELERRGVAPENIYVSMERNMKCAVGFCGHCQYGPTFICKDGPVFRYDRVARLLAMREI